MIGVDGREVSYAAVPRQRSTSPLRQLSRALGCGVLAAVLSWSCSEGLPSGADNPADGDPAGPVPIVSHVEPRILPRGATLDLRIFGSGFDAASRVRLRAQGAPANAVVTNSTRYVSSGELTASITTAGDAPAGPYEVVVTSGAGKQGVGTELVDFAPHIRSITPSPVSPGGTINISGWNFGFEISRVRVTVDGHEAAVLSAADTLVVAVVPSEVSFGMVTVELSVLGVSIAASSTLEIMDVSSPPPTRPSGRFEVGSVSLLPDSLTIAVGDTARLRVIVRNTRGAVIADPQFAIHCATRIGFCLDGQFPIATIDSIGLVTAGPAPGTAEIVAWSLGVSSNTIYLTVYGNEACIGCWDY